VKRRARYAGESAPILMALLAALRPPGRPAGMQGDVVVYHPFGTCPASEEVGRRTAEPVAATAG